MRIGADPGETMLKRAAKRLIEVIPGARAWAESPAGQALRYRFALHFEDRPGFTFTQFLRLPTQLAALTGPVLDFVGTRERSEPLRIVVAACSTGAEPYTISSLLLERNPDLQVRIDAFDIDADVVAIAQSRRYAETIVRSNPLVTDAFIARTFDRDGDSFVVKPVVADRVHFRVLDATDAKARAGIAPADIVFAQNVMCNLRRDVSRRLFDNVVLMMKPRAVLFVDGMDTDMRERRTRALGFAPLDVDIEQIHREAEIVRGERYPHHAAGLDPLTKSRADWKQRYATIFLKRDGGA
jgi:chemotaxis protein methyltransferase CheR